MSKHLSLSSLYLKVNIELNLYSIHDLPTRRNWLYWVEKNVSLSPECMLLLDTDLAVTSSLSKRGRLLTSSWGAMGTILLTRGFAFRDRPHLHGIMRCQKLFILLLKLR